MRSKISIFKIITISCVSLALFLISSYKEEAKCFAEETVFTPHYEKIIKQYPSMEQYIALTRRNIKNNWYPSAASFENSATIILLITKNGTLLDSGIIVSSGNKDFDNSLMEAVEKTKFEPLPEDVNEELVNIDMTFKMERRHIINKIKQEQ